MVTEEELRAKIYEEFGEKLKGQDLEIKIIIQEKAPVPSEIEAGGVLTYLGKIGQYFVHAVQKGFKILTFICSILAITHLPADLAIFMPKSYEFVENFGVRLFNGDNSAITEVSQDPDSYVLLRQSWIESRNNFQSDNRNFITNPENRFPADAFLASGSSSSDVLANGTTAIWNVKFI